MVDLNRSRTLLHGVEAVVVDDLNAVDQQTRTIIAFSKQRPDSRRRENDLTFKHRANIIGEARTCKNTICGRKIHLRQHFGGYWHQWPKVRQFTQ